MYTPMRGFVPTPPQVVDLMVDQLFRSSPPKTTSTLLDAGSGPGAFVEGVIRWCKANHRPIPRITAVEQDPEHCRTLRQKFGRVRQVRVYRADFLKQPLGSFDFVIGNPPYVP